VVPHQVNLRIIDACLERMGWNSDKVMINIDKYGNTSAASVPVALDEGVRAGRVEKGKLVVLVAFGAGLTWGGALIRW
jgi:3-oxoacyl-[acyl-carrier-protein] synthase-3